MGPAIPAAEQARSLHVKHVKAIETQGRLAMSAEAAANLAWVSAHAAAVLYVTARLKMPDPAVVDDLRDHPMDATFKSATEQGE